MFRAGLLRSGVTEETGRVVPQRYSSFQMFRVLDYGGRDSQFFGTDSQSQPLHQRQHCPEYSALKSTPITV